MNHESRDNYAELMSAALRKSLSLKRKKLKKLKIETFHNSHKIFD